MNKKAIIFIIVVILVIIGLFVVNNSLKTSTSGSPTATTTPTEKDYDNTISVPNQAGGMTVFVGDVSFKDGGYIVIQRQNDGVVGKTIGVSDYLPKGEKQNILINLNEKVVEGDVLVATLYGDDGDQVFDQTKDQAFVGTDSNPISAGFTIISEGKLDNEVKL